MSRAGDRSRGNVPALTDDHEHASYTHPGDKFDMHAFLVDRDGGLHDGAEAIIEAREHLDGKPPTAGTFTTKDVTTKPSSIIDEHMELLGAWPTPDYYTESRRRRYVNPDFVHRRQYADVIVECACGTPVLRMDGKNQDCPVGVEDHAPDCTDRDKKDARERLRERRVAEHERLRALGWSGEEIAVRFGMKHNNAARFARYEGLDGGSLGHGTTDEYRRLAANTYWFLHYVSGVKTKTITRIYGVSRNALCRWKNGHLDVDESDVLDRWRGAAEGDEDDQEYEPWH